ncbi:MAG TPA: ribonuclease HII [Oculatellaceae cyanobacterium]
MVKEKSLANGKNGTQRVTKRASSLESARATGSAAGAPSKSQAQPQKRLVVATAERGESAPSAAALAREKKNRDRLRKLLNFDKKQKAEREPERAIVHLVGTDEVGRGCLAGPVVAAAVILPEIKPGSAIAKSLIELNDSKKLTFPQRERLALILQDISIWAIAEASPAEINEINILHASLLAMKRAVAQLPVKTRLDDSSTLVLIDGNKTIKDLDLEQQAVIDGDAKSASIAAASIIAKVYRDRLMMNLSQSFPAFNWHQNKGYGSSTHRTALRQLGMTEWHRRVFCEKILVEQMTLDLDFSASVDDFEELEDLTEFEDA